MEDNFSLSGDPNVTHVMLDVSHRLSGFVSLAAYQNNGRLTFPTPRQQHLSNPFK
jgi:hypothetical protein